MADKKTTKDLTPRELELTAMVFQCFHDGPPKINFEKLARVAGFKNASSASACWGPVKKKLMAMSDAAAAGNDNGGPSAPKAKANAKGATANPNKRKAVKFELEEAGEAVKAVRLFPPVKKARAQNGKSMAVGKAKGKATKSAAVAADSDSDLESDDDEEDDADYDV